MSPDVMRADGARQRIIVFDDDSFWEAQLARFFDAEDHFEVGRRRQSELLAGELSLPAAVAYVLPLKEGNERDLRVLERWLATPAVDRGLVLLGAGCEGIEADLRSLGVASVLYWADPLKTVCETLLAIARREEQGDRLAVTIDLPTPAYPGRERIEAAVQTAVSEQEPGRAVDIEWISNVRGKHAGGNIGLKIANIVAVGSGKGGVGKSTVASTLAYGLRHFGARVGLMDADVYGPSIPHLVGASGQPTMKQIPAGEGRMIERIEPIQADGIPLMSMGFLLVDTDQAVIWRGPMLHKALTQFLQQTEWGELDYLIVDMPPGTGDVALTLSQLVPLAGAVVVCTPQQVALLDAVKAITMFKTVKIPLLGVVENMSGEMFGRGGAKNKAEELSIPFLGEVPSEPQIRILGDAGEISKLFEEDSPAKDALLEMASRTAIEIARQTLDGPKMPTLEIL
ncbi:Iron-sulfur cluster carrier protein [Durusdinium trenchii]|uniref:Iron-sulfur cluster carrier protein n=1 Tax=Durusdinium trenchii TaxID=1381693 RepID=A0ABP0JDZ9_9DINO